MENATITLCALCNTDLPQHPIIDNDQSFCCSGCHAVYKVLLVRGGIEGYEEDPLFKQAVKAGLISNPQLLARLREQKKSLPTEELHSFHLEVSDMWCPSCAEVIKLFLMQEKGIQCCVVDYTTDLASVEYSPRYLTKDRIVRIIEGLGYSVCRLGMAEKRKVNVTLYKRLAVAAFCAMNLMMLSFPLYSSYFERDGAPHAGSIAWLSLAASLPVMTYCSWPIYRRFLLSLKTGLLGMETLVTIGTAAAFFLSLYEMFLGGDRIYFDTMSMVIFFVLLGKVVEAKAKFSAKESLIHLNRALPRRGRKQFEDGTEGFVLLKELAQGDRIVVLTGEKIVADGVVIEGEGSCDESLLTGEAIPVLKAAGSKVLSGTVLTTGKVVVEMASAAENSLIHQIVHTVEQDLSKKQPYHRAADAIVKWFVPTVLAVAAVCAVFDIPRAISVLLISCPCAIGIAAPLAEALLISRLASKGIIVRNRGVLKLLAHLNCFLFDKTGTITRGHFSVQRGLDILTPAQLSILQALTSQSIHPIASSISAFLPPSPVKIKQIFEYAGKGVKGAYQNHIYYVGSEKFLKEVGVIVDPQTLPSSSLEIVTWVGFAEDQTLLTWISLGDSIKEEIPALIQALKPLPAVLLSGDAQRSVQAVAEACRFDEWYWEKDPLAKRAIVDTIRQSGKTLCMVGDGINDAPALAGAHVGISVANATDISIQVSDLLLTTDRLAVLPQVLHLGKVGNRIIGQNLFWAFFYNVVGIPIAIMGVLSPLYAAGAMVLSSLIVTFNALRLYRK